MSSTPEQVRINNFIKNSFEINENNLFIDAEYDSDNKEENQQSNTENNDSF